jgi:hypothetical protein
MLAASDFDSFKSSKRVYVKDKIEKHKLNNFLNRADLMRMAEDDCLLFLDESFLGLWGEGVLFTNNYLVYNLSGETGHIPFIRISNIHLRGPAIQINSSLTLKFKKIAPDVVADIFDKLNLSLKRNDASFIDVNNHIQGPGPVSKISPEDLVVQFFLFVKLTDNKARIAELMGEDNFKDKESIRQYIASDENLRMLAKDLVEPTGLEKNKAEETIDFFYSAFNYYSIFLYDEINIHKDDLARTKERELKLQRKSEISAKPAGNASTTTSTSICFFLNVFSDKSQPTSNFIDAFLSVVNGYSRKFKTNESEYWFIFNAHLDYYFYILATKKILQEPGLNQIFIAPLMFLLEGNKERMRELSGLMNDETIRESIANNVILITHQQNGMKENIFNSLYEKALLSNKEISESDFIHGLSFIKDKIEELIVEISRPQQERPSAIDNLF